MKLMLSLDIKLTHLLRWFSRPLKCYEDGKYIPGSYLIMLWEDYNQKRLREHPKRVAHGNRQYVWDSELVLNGTQ